MYKNFSIVFLWFTHSVFKNEWVDGMSMVEANSVLPLSPFKVFCSTYPAWLCISLHISSSPLLFTTLLIKPSSSLSWWMNPPHIFLQWCGTGQSGMWGPQPVAGERCKSPAVGAEWKSRLSKKPEQVTLWGNRSYQWVCLHFHYHFECSKSKDTLDHT